MFAKIKPGGKVGQDHRFFSYPGDDTIFEVTKVRKAPDPLYKCVADGYGNLNGRYGDGAIYVWRLKDLLPVDKGE
jgi:hypothetical protein